MDTAGLASLVIAALIVGLLLAFACQLLLAGLGVALGLTLWGQTLQAQLRSLADSEQADLEPPEASEPEPGGGPSLEQVGFWLGLGLLLTINSVVFIACYLAVRFCQPPDVYTGAILGLLIWTAYALVMLWLSARTANSVVGLVISSAIAGLRQVFAGVRSLWQATLGGATGTSETGTGEPREDQVRQEVAAVLENLDIPALIEDYVETQLETAETSNIETLPVLFEQLLQEVGPIAVEGPGEDSTIRGIVSQWVTQQQGIPEAAVDDLVDQLTAIWQRQTTPQTAAVEPLEHWLSQAELGDLSPEQLRQWLNQAAQGDEPGDESQPNSPAIATPETNSPGHNPQAESGFLAQGVGTVSRRLKRILRQRLDLSDLDVATVWGHLSPLLEDWLSEEAPASPALPHSLVQQDLVQEDVEDYLSTIPPWRFTPAILETEFAQVLVDPEAAVDLIRPQVMALTPDSFTQTLTQRGDLSSETIQAITTTLEQVRTSVLTTLAPQAAPDPDIAIPEEATPIYQGLENYLRYTSLSQITPETLDHKLDTLVAAAELSPAQVQQLPLPLAPLREVLSRRRGLEPDQQAQWLQQIDQYWQQHIASPVAPDAVDQAIQRVQGELVHQLKPPRRWFVRRAETAQDLGRNVMDYLVHSPVEELSPAAIARNFQWLVRHSNLSPNPVDGVVDGMQSALGEAISHIDWQALQQALGQRQDLAAEQASTIVNQLKTLLSQGGDRAQATLEQVLEQVQGAWHRASQFNLDRDQLKADLQALWQHPPAALADLTNPLALLDQGGHLADRVADLSQQLFEQVLAAQSQVSDTLQTQTQEFKAWVRSRLEPLEAEIKARQQAVKRLALQRLYDARGVVAAAAWWLVTITLTSVTTAIAAGMLAVTDLADLAELVTWVKGWM